MTEQRDDDEAFLEAATPTDAATRIIPGQVQFNSDTVEHFGEILTHILSDRPSREHRAASGVLEHLAKNAQLLTQDTQYHLPRWIERHLINRRSRIGLAILLWTVVASLLLAWHDLNVFGATRPPKLLDSQGWPIWEVGILLLYGLQEATLIYRFEYGDIFLLPLVSGVLLSVAWRFMYIQARVPTGRQQVATTLVTDSGDSVKMFGSVTGDQPRDSSLERLQDEITRAYSDGMCQFQTVEHFDATLEEFVSETARRVEAGRLSIDETSLRSILGHDGTIQDLFDRQLTRDLDATTEAVLPLDYLVTELSRMDRPAVIQITAAPRRLDDVYLRDKVRASGEILDTPPMQRLFMVLGVALKIPLGFIVRTLDGSFSSGTSNSRNNQSRRRSRETRRSQPPRSTDTAAEVFPGADGCRHTPLYDLNIRYVALDPPSAAGTAPALHRLYGKVTGRAVDGPTTSSIQRLIEEVTSQGMKQSTDSVSVATAVSAAAKADIAADIDDAAVNYDVPHGLLGFRGTPRRNAVVDRTNVAAYLLVSGAGSERAQHALEMLRPEDWGRGGGHTGQFRHESDDD